MIELHFAGCVALEILRKIGLPLVAIKRRASTARYDEIHPMRARIINIGFDPMFKKVVVASKQQLDVVSTKQGHVAGSQRR